MILSNKANPISLNLSKKQLASLEATAESVGVEATHGNQKSLLVPFLYLLASEPTLVAQRILLTRPEADYE